MRLIQPSLRDGRNTKPLLPVLKRRAWSLDVLHANGVRAYQPRATPWDWSLDIFG
jgi:hypothetical protein